MRTFTAIMTLFMLALLLSTTSVPAQTNASSGASTDAGITPLSVLGIVSEIQLNAGLVTVKTNAGNE